MEIVVFDPEDIDTYPSVCVTPNEVESRFGFVGGERLGFDEHGSFIGPLNEKDQPEYDFRRAE